MGMLSLQTCIFIFSPLLISSFLLQPTIAYCTGRKILTNATGTISDGLDNYTNYTRCEWLIDAGSADKFILLEFTSMVTECSYDFVMVYDGNSFNSTVLATYSGNTLPRPVLASSGYMLVYMFSDRNYNLEGFSANFTILDCPFSCHKHGQCVNHTCVCDNGYTGWTCENRICPNDCSLQGHCRQTGCDCFQGFIGDSCSLSLHSINDVRWYKISHSSQNFTSRFGHSGAFIKSLNCIYVFAGFSLHGTLGDVVRYCLNTSSWEIAIQSKPWPPARKNHASMVVEDGFYVLGGVLENGLFSNELWYYDAITFNWTKKAINSSIPLPKLMDHTLTYANGWLYVIGGKNHEGLFSTDIFRINITNCDSWEKLQISGDRKQTRMVSGHTAVFHEVANSILVYGGYRSTYSKYVELSSDIYSFNLQYHVWSHVENRQTQFPQYVGRVDQIPHKRAHHTSVIMGNYMIVYGGNIHIHQTLETCYDNDIFLYHLGCHKWINHPQFMDVDTKGERRYGHIAVPVSGNIMFVIGGYSGSVLGDITAFKFPPTIALSEYETQDETDYCMQYTDPGGLGTNACKEDVECVLCIARKDTSRTGCVHRTRTKMCHALKHYESSECPGICPSLRSCEACLGNGQGVTMTTTSPKNRFYQEECSWCVKSATCQKAWVPEGVCLSATDTDSGLEGWWNGTSPSWYSIEQCTNNDFQAGIQMIYYYPPEDILQPDYVVYLNKFQVDVRTVLPFHGNINSIGSVIKARITGFIHPLNAPLSYGTQQLQLYMNIAGDVKVTLNLSNDSSVKNHEIVIHQTTYKKNVGSKVKANRQNRARLFPHRERGYKYYLAIETERFVEEGKAELELMWNVDWSHHKDNLVTISMEFLEPYNSIHCLIHANCLACMTDASCAWCSSSKTCFYKGDNSSSCEETIAVTHPQQCDLCHDHPDCYSCVTNELCEWSIDHEKCIRRGRKLQHARTITECPSPCFMRKNCLSCVEKDRDECFWCENTHECFPFAHYISHHMSGQCQEWVDSDDLKHNHSCRDCSTYKSCDSCLKRHGCGWCGNIDNRLIGRCVDGDFSGPAKALKCAEIVAEEGKDKNITVDDPSAWMYDTCLDVDECALGIFECDENAYCENTDVSYVCKCKRGYIEDGRTCQKTCYHECINGKCGTNYECNCYLGWTGPDCNTDCQCNNQSMCSKGVGLCDRCHHNTGGTYCQLCLPGYYGKPSQGCKPCDCNQHSDHTKGHCDSDTGQCHCTDNTSGHHCQQCQNGYYGDARNGGKCYRNCDSRVRLDQTSGSFGSYKGSGVNETKTYCIWIIYDKSIEEISGDQRLVLEMDISVTMTIDDMALNCGKEHVYVYEGIPSFVYDTKATVSGGGLLASFCGEERSRSVTSKSRIMTIYFETDSSIPGFNASYRVNDCDKNCMYMYQQHRVCKENQCVCESGYSGDSCQEFICSDGCTFDKDAQSCSCKTSIGQMEIFPWYSSLQPDVRRSEDVNLGRYGHTIVAVGSESLYMFGGFSLKHGLLNDLWKFNLSSKKWTQIIPITTTEPSGRYFHSAVYLDYLKTMYVYGGFVKAENGNIQASNEMWKFAIGAHKWTVEEPSEEEAVAGHTMTKIGDASLLIIGGSSTENYFSETMYEYDATNSNWRRYSHKDQIGAPIGIYGHSAIYHEETQTVYIYGGVLYRNEEGISSSGQLYAFDLELKRWNILQPTQGTNRTFHTAVNAGKYMAIFGGQSDKSYHGNTALVYNFKCNNWFQVNFTAGYTKFMVSAAAVYLSKDVYGKDVYLMGGYDGEVHSRLIKLSLPVDSCRLIGDKDTCAKTAGCKGCVYNDTSGDNLISCFSVSMNQFLPAECYPSSKVVPGQGECNLGWYKKRRCDVHKTCKSCLAVHPYFKDSHNAKEGCHWCTNTGNEKCIHSESEHCTSSCTDANCCIEECSAGTCDKCNVMNCEWTNNIYDSVFPKQSQSQYPHVFSIPPSKESWHCQPKRSRDNNRCSKPCHESKECLTCRQRSGAEGVSGTCVWSQALRECMPEANMQLVCSHGNCGLVLDHIAHQPILCPNHCEDFSQCSQCLNMPGCGWCAGQNGKGICMEGGIMKPSNNICNDMEITYGHIFQTKYRRLGTTQPEWIYMSCPPENECENGHHTCDPETQNCNDTLEGYICTCKKGYSALETGECIPICHQGCLHGRCVKPDICDCNFGYVGNNCTVECGCHKNSECESVDNKRHCLYCHNNTQGAQCEHCKIWYVGNPKQDIPCKSCFNVCHNHTARCSSDKDFRRLLSSTPIYSTHGYDKVVNLNGPTDHPRCIRCENNTDGRLCDVCQEGYFRLKHHKTSLFDACQECQCHGHSNKCNNMTGECRPCYNNTKTRCSSDDESIDKCWMLQCAHCDEYFQGWPVYNHHCYRQVTVDREYCLDPDTQNECNQNPQPLLPGRTVFFCVQPRYLNVDIRITIDILKGGADIFLSPNDQTFTVKVNKENGVHILELDKNLQFMRSSKRKWRWRKTSSKNKRSLPLNNINLQNIMPELTSSEEDKFSMQNGTSGIIYDLMDIKAEHFHTYHTINKANTILRVKNVESRLVITIPVQSHNLRTAKFFMVMYGTGGKNGNNTYGNLYFRQDQPHIDLFVFFSVFFSSFFLFLAICVLLWKMKQAVDTQRSRQQRAKEMMHMASRPFSKVIVYIEPEPILMSSTPILRRQKLPKIPNRNNVPIMGLPPVEILPPIVHTTMTIKEIVPFDVIPIAVEPISSGSAAIRTVVIQLPGGPNATSKLCLGSTLTMNYRQPNSGPKGTARRRPSATVY